MANIAPFRALRFTGGPDISAHTAPPYDVIGPSLHEQLLAQPENIVHVDFGLGSTDPAEPGNRYQRAAEQLAAWRAAGVLAVDENPALYVYEQDYEWGDQTFTRRSLFAAVRLEALGSGHIHPHEQTFSGPKEDRFQVTRHTQCALSQHLGIYPDETNEVMALLAPFTQRVPDATATGLADGVRNRLWVVTERPAIEAVQAALADRDIFIADGHHRYEMMRRYRQTLADAGELTDDHPANYTIFVLTGSGDPGLLVMPTHRVVGGWPSATAERVAEALAEHFDAAPLDVDPTDGTALDAALAEADLSAVGLLTTDGLLLLTPRDPAWVAAELADLSPALRELNVSVLHKLMMPRLEAAFGQPQLSYVHQASEAVEALVEGADLAFLLRATPLESVLDVALAHELMPQKTTYFYPKVLTGLVMYPLA